MTMQRIASVYFRILRKHHVYFLLSFSASSTRLRMATRSAKRQAFKAAEEIERKVKQDWETNVVNGERVWINRDCFWECWEDIWQWIDIGSLTGLLMKHRILNDTNDYFLIDSSKGPRKRADNLLHELVPNAGKYGHYLLYMCIRDCNENRYGHADAIKELVKFARKNKFLPPWECQDLQPIDDHVDDNSHSSHSARPQPKPQPPKFSEDSQVQPTQTCSSIQDRYEDPKLFTYEGHLKQLIQSGDQNLMQKTAMILQQLLPSEQTFGGQNVIPQQELTSYGDAERDTVSQPSSSITHIIHSPSSTAGPELGAVPAMVRYLVERGAFDEIIRKFENQIEIEFASPDVCQQDGDFITTLLRFIVACFNSRVMGVFIAGVDAESEEQSYAPVEFRFSCSMVSDNFAERFSQAVLVKNRSGDAILSEEIKLVTLDFIHMQSTAHTVALATVKADSRICKNNLYMCRIGEGRGEILKRSEGGTLHIQRAEKIRELQKSLDKYYQS